MIALTYTQGLLYLVVDVGNVHDEVHIQAKVVHHDAADDVGGHIVPGMAQVALVVYCRAASIPAHFAGLGRVEADWGARLERVVHAEGVDGLAHCGGSDQAAVTKEVMWIARWTKGAKGES